MVTKIQKWGNSQGLRFPREVLRKASMDVGEEVDISVRNGEIVVKAAIPIRRKYRLKDLVAKMPLHYKACEEDWGGIKGKEVW
jgi:antitoxin MazE